MKIEVSHPIFQNHSNINFH